MQLIRLFRCHVGWGSGSVLTDNHTSLFSLIVTPILRYMGDYPSRQAWTSTELTDQIFSWALQDTVLQDEVYCQILKQLTHKTKRSAGDGVGMAPKAVTTVQTWRWKLLEATQPAQALAVAEGWAGTLVCPADFLE